MLTQDRKAAVAAYKERKVVAGIYLVRCGATGECWAGQAPDLSTIQNRVWFTLRLGSLRQRCLQAAWNAHGESAIALRVLEGAQQVEGVEAHLIEAEEMATHPHDLVNFDGFILQPLL